MKKIISLLLISISAIACTHKKVTVDQVNDDKLTCQELAIEIIDLQDLKKDIDSKTGFSGRNIGMIIFWPGIVINEYNGNKANDLADSRNTKLLNLFKQKQCDSTLITNEEKNTQAKKETTNSTNEKK